jgi:hypothetical protein
MYSPTSQCYSYSAKVVHYFNQGSVATLGIAKMKRYRFLLIPDLFKCHIIKHNANTYGCSVFNHNHSIKQSLFPFSVSMYKYPSDLIRIFKWSGLKWRCMCIIIIIIISLLISLLLGHRHSLWITHKEDGP